ncbi:MAG: hypothetical protein ACOX9R_03355 [Armatimonadota bacterium]|jgi:hypothetical protein
MKPVLLWCATLGLLTTGPGAAQVQRQNGFADHGVAAPTAISRGTTAAIDSEGRRLVLIWLRSSDSISQLAINVDTGEVTQVEVPGPSGAPFAVLHSSRNLWYGHLSGHFYEFDPDSLTFTFVGETPRNWAGALTEAPDGVIWGILNPDGHLISFNPDTRELADHGVVNQETWVQIPRAIAADDPGWVYVGTGNAKAQVIGYQIATGEIRRYVPETDRAYGEGQLFRGTDGHVYARAPGSGWDWHLLNAGEATPVGEPQVSRAPIRAGAQSSVFRDFGDGSSIATLNVPDRLLVVREADGTEREIRFDYDFGGANITSMASGPYDRVYGSTSHTMRFFTYEPATDELIDHGGVPAIGDGNFCAITHVDRHVYGAEYAGGRLWQVDPARPWRPAVEGDDQNPRMLARWRRDIMRPRTVLAHPDGRHVLMAGYAVDGLIGGGIGIYNLETGEDELLTAEEHLLPGQSCITLKALPDGRLVGGTDVTSAWAEQTATEAELFIIDWDTREIAFRTVPVEGDVRIVSIEVGPDGMVYGLSGNSTFFVFDPQTNAVVHSESFAEYGGVPRHALHAGHDGNIYALMTRTILQIAPGGREHLRLAESPVGISAGGALHEGVLYFAAGTRVWSYEIPAGAPPADAG